MKKSILIFLSAILTISLFVSCNGDPGTKVETKIIITFDKNGGTGVMAALSAKKGENVKLTANTFTWAEHAFKGWNTKADGSGFFYENEATDKFDSDTTLYAQWWQPKVTFNGNGATSGSMPVQSVGYNTPVTLSTNTFEKTGNVFLGWNTKADGSGQTYANEQSVTLTMNLDLYAQWAIDVATNTDYKAVWNAANGSFYTMSSSTSINTRITVTGSVTLLLTDGMTLNAQKGITVADTNALTIDGTGTLTATGDSHQAGIGGEENGTGGVITINGGTVTATGGDSGSGIGGGRQGNGGLVTINGGDITATGGVGGAGIGGGTRSYSTKGNGGTVIINGGIITAKTNTTGLAHGAGIGGGASGDGGQVTINGGYVVANGYGTKTADFDTGSAGIGGGYCGDGGIVTINGGTVIATGKYGSAGIGAGLESTSHGTLKIGTGLALYGDSSSPAHTKISDDTDDYTGERYQYMKAE